MKSLVMFLTFFSLLLADTISPLPSIESLKSSEKVDVPFQIETFKVLWLKRIQTMRAQGILPLTDIESSFNPGKFNLLTYAKMMDDYGVALIAFSPQIGEESFDKDKKLWHDAPRQLMYADPNRYIPTTTAGIYPAWTKEPLAFVKETIEKSKQHNYPLLGEFEFRHYPSPRQVKRNEFYRDVNIPIDSEAAHLLFAFSEQSGKSFQIHYEIEDTLLEPLEKMLQTYPNAKVIWCHLAQVRYSDKSKIYSPHYIKTLLERYPNLYFDLAFGDSHSVYQPSKEFHATIWNRSSGAFKQEWTELIEAYPYRFLMAFDIGGDRHDELLDKVKTARESLKSLSQKSQEIVAYKALWKLLFNEVLD